MITTIAAECAEQQQDWPAVVATGLFLAFIAFIFWTTNR